MDDFSWTLRVCSADRDRAAVFVRKHRFEVGAPVQFDPDYGQITALEYALGAVGADVVNGLRYLARKRRVEIDDVECVVQGELNNPLTHLGVIGEEGHPGLEKMTLRVYVRSVEEESEVRRVWEEMLEKSPMVRTFAQAIRLELSVQVMI